MRNDVDARVAEIITGLVRLGRLLPREDYEDLLGSVAVEVETGLELVLERQLTRRVIGNVLSFPGGRCPTGGEVVGADASDASDT